jgi:hypothetical protein
MLYKINLSHRIIDVNKILGKTGKIRKKGKNYIIDRNGRIIISDIVVDQILLIWYK